MAIIDAIKKLLRDVWEFIKKIFVKVINFFKNIVNWFQEPDRLKKIQSDKKVIAVAIKENLEKGNYNVVNCLYNQETEELVDVKEDVLSITAEQLDSQTSSYFGKKEMIIVQ